MLVCAGALMVSQALAAEPAVLGLDHVYILVQHPPSAALDALRRAGLTIGPDFSRHAGQGTASASAYFGNAYLELLWIDPDVPSDAEHARTLAEFGRATDWRNSGASPFGLGLHFQSGAAADLSVPFRLEPATHLGSGQHYVLLRQGSEASAMEMFIVPPPADLTRWIERFRGRHPELLVHPLGAERVTGVRFHGTLLQRPQAAALAPAVVRFETTADEPLLELEFDGGREGLVRDLRPELPLVLKR